MEESIEELLLYISIGVLNYLFWVAICGAILDSRGYKPTGGAEWGWGFLGIIGVFVCIAKPDMNSQSYGQNTGSIRANIDNNSVSMQNNHRNNVQSAAKELGEWKELLDKGVITQEDFDLKKRELLNIGQKPHG